MPVLMIGYELDQPEADEPPILDAIKGIGPYWRFLPTDWLVASPYTAAKAGERLRATHGDADRLVVLNVTARDGWAVHGVSPRAHQWLERHLPTGTAR